MRWKQPFAAAALLAALAGCVGDVPTAAGPRDLQPAGPSLAMNATSSRVVGYFPYWYKGSLDAIPYGKFTHLVYAFADPTPTGGITLSGDSLKLKGVIQRAHTAGVPVLISFGGWSGSVDSDFEPMAADPAYRATFVNNVVAFVAHYGLDGVDIDWEFPNTAAESASFSALMSELGSAMRAQGKMLTAAVASSSYYGKWIGSDVFASVDFLFLMAYAHSSVPHSSFAHAVESLDYWRDVRGLAQGKTVLGVPFYGKNASGANLDYRELVRLDPQAPGKDESNGYHYNGLATIKSKTTLSLQRGSGIGIWEITQDTTLASISLLEAIHQAMSSPVPPYDYTRVVYADALNGWGDWSWNVTVNFAGTSPVYQGSNAISATYTAAWGGVQLNYGGGFSGANVTRLEFYVHGGTAGGQNVRVYLVDSNGTSLTKVPLNSYVEGGSVAAGAWRKVSIPLSAMGVGTNPVQRLVFQDGAGGVQPTFHLDYIRFVP